MQTENALNQRIPFAMMVLTLAAFLPLLMHSYAMEVKSEPELL